MHEKGWRLIHFSLEKHNEQFSRLTGNFWDVSLKFAFQKYFFLGQYFHSWPSVCFDKLIYTILMIM